jgi:PadR family transcriptional regulator PadR
MKGTLEILIIQKVAIFKIETELIEAKMNIDNSKAQMRKGILEYCILLILSKKPLYASDIIGELKAAQMIVVEGTLYPLLTRLKNDGYLSYKWEESLQGPPRKYYELTEEGGKFLSELEISWSELVDAIRQLKDKG